MGLRTNEVAVFWLIITRLRTLEWISSNIKSPLSTAVGKGDYFQKS